MGDVVIQPVWDLLLGKTPFSQELVFGQFESDQPLELITRDVIVLKTYYDMTVMIAIKVVSPHYFLFSITTQAAQVVKSNPESEPFHIFTHEIYNLAYL